MLTTGWSCTLPKTGIGMSSKVVLMALPFDELRFESISEGRSKRVPDFTFSKFTASPEFGIVASKQYEEDPLLELERSR